MRIAYSAASALVIFAAAPAHAATLPEFLSALGQVETGHRDVQGDDGDALGPLQIHRAYFEDSGVEGRYEDCHDEAFSRRVVVAYLRRYCPDALRRGDWETCARVHNGGPNGARKESTRAYGKRVMRALQQETR